MKLHDPPIYPDYCYQAPLPLIIPSYDSDPKYTAQLYQTQLYSEETEQIITSLKERPPPPEYGADCTIEPLNSFNRPSRPISIKFSHFPNGKKNSYSNGDAVIGTLKIAPTTAIHAESISIYLEGEEVVKNSTWSYDQVLRRHMKLARHDIVNLPEDNQLIPGYLYSFAFSIEIPQIQSISACKDLVKDADPITLHHNHHNCDGSIGFSHLNLPSSMGVHPDQSVSPLVDVGSQTARVSYKLKPILRGLNQTTASPYVAVESDFYITILPSYPLPLHLLTPPETPFTAIQQFSRKSGLLATAKKSVGTLQVTADRFPILPLYTRDSHVIELPLNIKFFPEAKCDTSEDAPPTIQSASLYLKARTVYSHTHTITKEMSNLNLIKPVQIENKLSDVADINKGIRTNLVNPLPDSEDVNSLNGFRLPTTNNHHHPTTRRRGSVHSYHSTTSLPSIAVSSFSSVSSSTATSKKKNLSSHLPPGFKEEFRMYTISDAAVSKCEWTASKSPSGDLDNLPVTLNHTSAIPQNYKTLSQASHKPTQTNYKKLSKTLHTSRVNVSFTLPRGSKSFDLVPSYESCYTRRDYTLVLSLDFGGSSPLVLELPVVVVTSMASAMSTQDLLAYYLDAQMLDETEEDGDEASIMHNETAGSLDEETEDRVVEQSLASFRMEVPYGTTGEASGSGSGSGLEPGQSPNGSEPDHASPTDPDLEAAVAVSLVNAGHAPEAPPTDVSDTVPSNRSRRPRNAAALSRSSSVSTYTAHRRRRGKKYLDMLPLPPMFKFSDSPLPFTPHYKPPANPNPNNTAFPYPHYYTINGIPAPYGSLTPSPYYINVNGVPVTGTGIGLDMPTNVPTTTMTTVGHYTGSQVRDDRSGGQQRRARPRGGQ